MKHLVQDDAWAIQKKLDAVVEDRRRHIRVMFKYKGKAVVSFGIRRGSSELPHNYIPMEMKISQKECRLFRECDMSVAQYIEILKAKGHIVE